MNVGRKTKAIIAVISSAAAVVAAVGVVPSLAGWTHTEVDHGVLSALGCSTPGTFTSQGWGQEIAGEVANVSLDSHLAGVLGVTVNSGVPSSTATGGVGTSPGGLNSWGNDAWSSDLQAGALNAITLNAGLSVPVGANLGAESQYGQATSTGSAKGASGAITTASGGLVSLNNPGGSAPGVGSIDLDSALSSAIGSQLGGMVSKLANASLDVGALGSLTSVDSCNDLWTGVSDASKVARSYVLAKLGLKFTSSAVGDLVSNTSTDVSALGSTLNALEPDGSILNSASITSALTSAISNTTSLLPVSIGGPTTGKVGVDFDLSSVTHLLTGSISDGPVSVNLDSGQISIDLAKLQTANSLNGLGANTELITPDTIATIEADLESLIDNLTDAVTNALNAVVAAAGVTVEVKTDVKVAGIDAASLDIHLSGTLAQFTDPTKRSQISISIDSPTIVSGAAGLLSAVLSFVGLSSLTQLLTIVTTSLTSSLASSLPALIASVATNAVDTTAIAAVSSTLGTLTSTVFSLAVPALDTVVNVVRDVVELTVNAQPDQSGSIGSPEPAMTGALFESALGLNVLDGPSGSPTISLFLGSSAVGPNTRN